jgi:mono/diheme cytochrome c family protein
MVSILDELFGTPADPIINVEVAKISESSIANLKLDKESLREGSRRYRIHCLHCHGVPGDGRGPTARWINPHPRDFRLGKFKFASVDNFKGIQTPARADLMRTLRNGLEGTAMPSFALLHDSDLELIISTVIHLSIRGSVENSLIKDSLEYDSKQDTFVLPQGTILKDDAIEDLQRQIKNWVKGNDPSNAIPVSTAPSTEDLNQLKESVHRGKQFFTAEFSPELKKKYRDQYMQKDKLTEKAAEEKVLSKMKSASCVSCHVDFGRQAKFRFDEWGTLVRPNNFTAGVFRGGRRPVDIYYRVHSGIKGSGMNAFGDVLEPGEIWDLVNFVSSLPYPAMRQKLGVSID